MAVNISGDGAIEGITSFNGGGLSLRNILYNGWVNTSDEINQRGKTLAQVSNGDYWADRWQRVSSTTMTQKVEEGNYIPNKTYTLSGTNVTTAQITSPSSGTWDWGTVPSNASLVQLELGETETSFEYRPKGYELSLCQRYFQNVQLGSSNQAEFAMVTSGGSSTNCTPHILYLSPMRDVGGAGNLTVDRTNMTAATGANSFTGAGTSRLPMNRAKGANGSYILALGCSDPPTNTTFALRIGGNVTVSAEL